MKSGLPSVVLLFHSLEEHDPASLRGLGNIGPSLFEGLCRAIREEFDVVSLRTLVEGISGPSAHSAGMIAVTFDDGGKSYGSFGAPIAGSLGIPTTCFLITDCIGGRVLYWRYLYNYCMRTGRGRELARMISEEYDLPVEVNDVVSLTRKLYDAAKTGKIMRRIAEEIVSDEEYRAKEGELFLSFDDIGRLAGDPLVEFGVHTRTHPVMRALGDDEIREEISGSVAFYREKIGDAFPMFSVPFGRLGRDYDERTVIAALELGLPAVFSAYGGGNEPGQPLSNIRRIPVTEERLAGGIGTFVQSLHEADVAPEYLERESALQKAVDEWKKCRGRNELRP